MTHIFMGRGEEAHRKEGDVGMEAEIGVRQPASQGMARIPGSHQKPGSGNKVFSYSVFSGVMAL